MKVDVITLAGKKSGTIELNAGIFGVTPRADILHRVVRWQRAGAQAGTHSAKIRSEVSYSGRKIHRQKGTGNARHGARRANIFRGGAKAHGPRPRSHAFSLPKKVRTLGLKHALSARAGSGRLTVIDEAKLKATKTAVLASCLSKLGMGAPLLFVEKESFERNFALSARNLPRVALVPVMGLNVVAILRARHLVLTRGAVAAIEERLA